ncbi:MAG TPA: hypothetical protein VLK84_17585 [Longimicrobium sp.]|nr:hypothetical protein [Longimicrobium sp.]
MGEKFDQREAPILGSRVRVEKQYTPSGPVYVPVESELQAPQEIVRETKRVIRRHILSPDGRTGVEETEEVDVEYAPAREQGGRVRGMNGFAAGFTAFIVVCLAFSAMGGSDQSPALIPMYWIGFAALWAWLAR